jgi:hypothetical protein
VTLPKTLVPIKSVRKNASSKSKSDQGIKSSSVGRIKASIHFANRCKGRKTSAWIGEVGKAGPAIPYGEYGIPSRLSEKLAIGFIENMPG